MQKEFKIGVFALIQNEDNCILFCLRNDYNIWNLPGGRLEKGESPWQGIVREVKEETGLDVEVVKMIGVYSKPNKDEIVFSFECKVLGGDLTLNNEASDIRYFNINEIPENTVQKQVERIRDFFEYRDSAILKIQQTDKSTIDLLKENIQKKKLQ